MFPLLARSRPEIAEFMRMLDSQPWTPQTFPTFERNPTTWPSSDPFIDDYWLSSVANRPRISNPAWLTDEEKFFVKPFRRKDARMLVL